jgi:hypothetical protein
MISARPTGAKLDLSDGGGVRVQLAEAAPTAQMFGSQKLMNSGRLAAEPLALAAGRVPAGDLALVAGLVQDRALAVDVAGDEHRQIAHLHAVAVERRQAALVQRHAQVLEAEPIDVRHPADAAQHPVHQHAVLAGADAQLSPSSSISAAWPRCSGNSLPIRSMAPGPPPGR